MTTTGTASRDLIIAQYIAAGLSERMGQAAAVNAYAESAWNSAAVGDSGASVGLFQLHENGLGESLALPRGPDGQPDPADPRFDAVKNTQATIDAVKADTDLMAMALDGDTSLATLVEYFCRDIERPASVDSEVTRRQTLATKLFPGVA